MTAPQRSDYRRNLRAKVQSGCVWCGVEVAPPVTSASYCSDECVQADHSGIDDIPPVIPLAYTDEAYVRRKWSQCHLYADTETRRKWIQ